MLLNLSGVSKYFGSELLFEQVSFEISEQDRVGLVGVNGAGKTTLFKILTGESGFDQGDFHKNKELRLGYMQQYLLADQKAGVYDEVLKVFSHLTELEAAIEDINLDIELKNGDVMELTERQHRLSTQFEDQGGFLFRSRVKATLMGLGFGEEDFKKPVSVLSGGERTRVQLAKMLLSGCNLLLLDEPTNHLDISAVEWLEDFLASWPGAFIVISHDRYFLDKITTRTFEMENGRLWAYQGNYSQYQQKKAAAITAMENKYENTMREIKRIEGIVEQQRRWNREKNIKTAENKLKMIDRLEQTLEAPPEEQEEIRFSFTTNKSGGNDVLMAENLKINFDGRTIFQNVDLHLRRGERVFLLGPNGCGKTTLFKILLGQYQPASGEVRLGSNIEVGYYDQTQEDLDDRKTVIDEIWDAYPKKTQTEIRNACAAFLFKGEDVFKEVSVLSGGEKARVSLLKLMLSGSNFLMLDEPTNHLDIASKEALENAFSGYAGTMFIISHDRYFINKLADRICVLTPGGIRRYDGNYDYYLEKSKAEEQPEKKEKRGNEYRQKKEVEAAKRKIQNRIAKIEEEIENKEEAHQSIEQRMAQPEVSTDYEEVLKLTAQAETLKAEIQDLYAEWETLNKDLEQYGSE